jgi:hypothetical protein
MTFSPYWRLRKGRLKQREISTEREKRKRLVEGQRFLCNALQFKTFGKSIVVLASRLLVYEAFSY